VNYIEEMGYDEEIIDQYLGTLNLLQIMLDIKKELGSNADIAGRYIGCCSCCDCTHLFLSNIITVALGLNDEQGSIITVDYWVYEDFIEKYPGIKILDDEGDEMVEIIFPTVYADICEQVYNSTPDKEKNFSYRKIDDNISHIYFQCFKWPEFEDFSDFFMKVRKIALGRDAS